ncbi:unnamed protein product [Calypogeia fissa]
MDHNAAPEATLLTLFVDVPTRKPKRPSVRAVIASESKDEREEATEEEVAEERPVGGEEEVVEERPTGDEEECGPYYLCRVRTAGMSLEDYKLVNELGQLTARTFVDEFIAGSLSSLLDHTSGLFKYIRWMALTITKQTSEFAELTLHVEALSDTNNYELLVKEKGQWSITNNQLKEELLKAQQTQQQAEQEWDGACSLHIQVKQACDQHLNTLVSLGDEIGTLKGDKLQLQTDISGLTVEVAQLKQQTTYLNQQLLDISEEKDDANQDVENVQNREAGLLQRISDLEVQLFAQQPPHTRQHMS